MAHLKKNIVTVDGRDHDANFARIAAPRKIFYKLFSLRHKFNTPSLPKLTVIKVALKHFGQLAISDNLAI